MEHDSATWRAFGAGTIIVGVINLVWLGSFFALPSHPLFGRDIPESWRLWAMVDCPPLARTKFPELLVDAWSKRGQLTVFLSTLGIGTIFWGVVAVGFRRALAWHRGSASHLSKPANNWRGSLVRFACAVLAIPPIVIVGVDRIWYWFQGNPHDATVLLITMWLIPLVDIDWCR